MSHTFHYPHFLQSEAWEAFQKRLGRTVLRDQGDGWSWMAVVEEGRLTKRLYAPYGPTANSAKALRAALASLRQHAIDQGADYVRVEPIVAETVDLKRFGAVRAARDLQPGHTVRVDLLRPEEDIIHGISTGNRRAHNGVARRGITFRKSTLPEDMPLFLDALHEVAATTGMRPQSDRYLTTQAEVLMPLGAAQLLIADVEGKPAAFILAYQDQHCRYYGHAAAHYEFHKAQPAAALMAFAMLDAKREGLEAFDLYGVSPPNEPNHPWAGFSTFKRSFGGAEVEFSGTWDIPVNKLKHAVEHAAHRLQGTVRTQRQKLYGHQKRLKRSLAKRRNKA